MAGTRKVFEIKIEKEGKGFSVQSAGKTGSKAEHPCIEPNTASEEQVPPLLNRLSLLELRSG